MRKIVLIVSLCLMILNTSCALKSAKLELMVQSKLIETKKNTISNQFVEFKINKKIEFANECKQDKNSFIPALLYWGWNSEIICEFSKETIENQINASIKDKMKSLGLNQIFDNKKLIINIDDLPSKFKYQEKGDVVILLFAYVDSEKRYIAPEKNVFKGSYKILDKNDSVILEKDFLENNMIKPQADVFKSSKKLSWQYINAYNNELDRFISVLLEDVKKNLEKIKS